MPKEEFQYQCTIESWKHFYDFYKHLTTISTGAILLMVTFLEKLFVQPEWRILVGVSFICFMIAVIGCVIGMHSIARTLNEGGNLTDVEQVIHFYSHVIVAFSFLVGVCALMSFGVKNFY